MIWTVERELGVVADLEFVTDWRKVLDEAVVVCRFWAESLDVAVERVGAREER